MNYVKQSNFLGVNFIVWNRVIQLLEKLDHRALIIPARGRQKYFELSRILKYTDTRG